MTNLFDSLPDARANEVFTDLLARPGVRIERIVSQGQVTPDDAPFVQDVEEWVVVLTGGARIRLEGQAEVALRPGDYLTIPARTRHWVTWTDPDSATVWLAVHLG